MNKRVVVNHAGRRDSYQLALAFQEANLLEKLVTDIYFDPEHSLIRKFLPAHSDFKRSQKGLPFDNVKISLAAAFGFVTNKLSYSAQRTRWQNQKLSALAYKTAKEQNANLFLYSYTAFEAFQQAEKHSSEMKRYLFQIHPSPVFIRTILIEELERYPFAKDSILCESEMKEDIEMDRLRNEPILAEHIIVASSFTKKSLEATGIDKRKISVVPYGIDFTSFPFQARATNSKKKFNILFVGQMVQRKGIADLFTAVRLLASSRIQVTICTRGHFDPAIASHFSELDVRIRRDLKHSELLDEFARADLFVFPSLVEGFGFVVLEAMHSGIPVITTSHTCGADLIEDGRDGFLVPIRDPETLAAKIDYCISNPEECNRIGIEGHQKARMYDWKKFRQEIRNIYTQLESQ